LAEKSLGGSALSQKEAEAILDWPEADLLTLLSAARQVRRAQFGDTVKIGYLVNMQSGLCPEDCHYCSQSKISEAPIEKYKMLSPEEVERRAEEAASRGAARVCLVASMRGPSDRDIEAVASAVSRVKKKYPHLELCACLGILKDGQAATLKDAGVDYYNHNLNTSERHYDKICSTHTYADRIATVEKVKAGGLLTCSGALFGMGETSEDIIDVAYKVRALEIASVPLNFLVPIKGTPLVNKDELTPNRCLKILCLFRFLNPTAELRMAGGRELQLRSLQPLGLYVANSLFIGDYLTTTGQPASADLQMIRDMGFTIVGEQKDNLPQPALSDQVVFTSTP
jgi:biotin synthase